MILTAPIIYNSRNYEVERNRIGANHEMKATPVLQGSTIEVMSHQMLSSFPSLAQSSSRESENSGEVTCCHISKTNFDVWKREMSSHSKCSPDSGRDIGRMCNGNFVSSTDPPGVNKEGKRASSTTVASDLNDDDSYSQATTPTSSSYTACPVDINVKRIVLVSSLARTESSNRGSRRVRFLSFVTIKTEEQEARQALQEDKHGKNVSDAQSPSVAARLARALSRSLSCMTPAV